MISIKRNGQQENVTMETTLFDALQQWDYVPGTFAVAINGQFVPHQQYDKTVLQAGDAVEVVSAMQGG